MAKRYTNTELDALSRHILNELTNIVNTPEKEKADKKETEMLLKNKDLDALFSVDSSIATLNESINKLEVERKLLFEKVKDDFMKNGVSLEKLYIYSVNYFPNNKETLRNTIFKELSKRGVPTLNEVKDVIVINGLDGIKATTALVKSSLLKINI